MNTPLSLKVKFRTLVHEISLPKDFTIGQLKSQLESLTCVPSDRQKLLNLIKGKLPLDSIKLSDLNLVQNHTFTLLGTPDSELLLEKNDDADDILDDFDLKDYNDFDRLKENQRSLARVIESTNIILINPWRAGKKLCVLDLDYTLFDCKSTATHISHLAR